MIPRVEVPELSAVEFMNLFPEFRQPSWDAWKAVRARETPETRELFWIFGRGSGESRMTAVEGARAETRTYQHAPGEMIFVGIVWPDKKQSGITLSYIRELLRSVPELNALKHACNGANHATAANKHQVVPVGRQVPMAFG